MQHVGRGLRPGGRCGEFDYARRESLPKRGEGKVGSRVVRFIDNHDRPAQAQHVHERRFGLAICAEQQVAYPI